MGETIKVLFSCVGRRVELVQAFRSAAKRLGIKLTIIGADISDTAPALAYCDETVIVPRISSPEYIPALVSICREKKIRALVPTIDTDLLLLAKEKQQFADIGTTVFVSAADKIAICRDKRVTSEYFTSIGLHAPVAVSDISEYSGGFPAFIKPIDGSSSIGANRADTYEDLQMYAKQLDTYVIQPFASGTEYTVDIFCDIHGEPIYITPRVRLAVRGGEVLKTQIHHEDSIISEIHTLIRNFKPCGPITVQLIRNEARGVNQYIEINPRFGGGAPLSMKAGADAAEAMLRLLSGEVLSYCPNAAAEDAVYSRFDQSVCLSVGKRRPVRAVIFDLDDTLYSEKEYVRSGYRKVAKLLPQIENAEEKLWSAFEQGKPAIDAVLQDAGLWDEELKARCLEVYRQQEPDIHLYNGVKQMLTHLRECGVKTGIITDGRPDGQRKKLEALGLYDLVDSILITDELGGIQFRKPCDIPFRIMQTRFNVPYESMVYVGDNPAKDFHAPRTLGMQWIYFENQVGLYSRNIANCKGKVKSIAEVLDLPNRMCEEYGENVVSHQ